jgi:hypothetical protein
MSAAIDFLARQPDEYRGLIDAEVRSVIDFTNSLLSINAFLYVE